ncbi:DUF1127 domain-containing protein [Rhizobium sp. CC-YZS058]|uniref:DUF1127 domain-containing protein n=1 Tax=Rhizobium sp. CC-YZS058 TaxID=3042153 RepID=UPI002B05B256|nr:DUF1127 domain-containing protein [Rhizobium sp. CC-YZS058]MEA3535829.1 DUF1127 domain-containing protein [Rhizobium sp. CC-YZS058]
MRTTSFAPTSIFAGRRPALRDVLQAVARLWHVLGNRRKTARLTELTDNQLADIGLTRVELRDALSASLLQDPSGALTIAARNRAALFYREARR